MTESQRDRAVAELVWLWVDYPGACMPPSILEKMIYGLVIPNMKAGSHVSELMTDMHATALDIRDALDGLKRRDRAILRLAFHPSNGPPGTASERVRSTYFRQGGKRHSPTERRARAEDAITAAIGAYARVRGIQ